MLAGPAELAWIDEPDVEVINAMTRGCAPQRPGTHPETSLRGEGAAGPADGVAVQNGGVGVEHVLHVELLLGCQFTNACAPPRPGWNTLIVDHAGTVRVEPRQEHLLGEPAHPVEFLGRVAEQVVGQTGLVGRTRRGTATRL